MQYKTENDIFEVIRDFKKCTIKRESWGHPEHLILAYHYATNNDLETALNKMRAGIFKLLEAFEVDLKKENPYHETLTEFWMRTINDFAKTREGYPIIETINEIITKFDKTYPDKFYTREHLFSDKARAEFIEPDIMPLEKFEQ